MLKRIIIALFLCLLALPSRGIEGCFLIWQVNGPFFANGGSVIVLNPDGSSYYVDSTNYDPLASYGLQSGSLIYVQRGAHQPCRSAPVWGYTIFEPCGQYGPSTPQTLTYNVNVSAYKAYITCFCPEGGSSGGIGIESQSSCQ